jgi:hypothetical protein
MKVGHVMTGTLEAQATIRVVDVDTHPSTVTIEYGDGSGGTKRMVMRRGEFLTLVMPFNCAPRFEPTLKEALKVIKRELDE